MTPSTIPQAQVDAAMSMLAQYGVPEEHARIALAAAYSAGSIDVPEGWQVVPIEPTGEMIVAWWRTRFYEGRSTERNTYMSMLAAAPTPPPTPPRCPTSPRTR